MQARAALAEAQRLVAAALHLPHHEDPERQQQDERRSVDQDRYPAGAARLFDVDLDTLILKDLVDLRIIGRNRGMQDGAVVLVGALDVDTAADGDLLDLVRLHIGDELGEGDVFFRLVLGGLDHLPEQHQHTR